MVSVDSWSLAGSGSSRFGQQARLLHELLMNRHHAAGASSILPAGTEFLSGRWSFGPELDYLPAFYTGWEEIKPFRVNKPAESGSQVLSTKRENLLCSAPHPLELSPRTPTINPLYC